MNKGVTSFYRRFDFFDFEKIAQKEVDDLIPISANQKFRGNNSNNRNNRNNNNNNNNNESKSNNTDESKSNLDSSTINLFEEFDPNCAVSGAGLICFGGNTGVIKFLNRDLEIFRFQSHSERVEKLFKTPDNDILIALGKHVEIPNGPVETFIHIWSLSDINELGYPKKIKSFRLFNETIQELPISALTATRSGHQIAVGCANGVVLLYNLNLNNRRNVYPKVRPIKLTKEGPHAVTGLHYLEANPRRMRDHNNHEDEDAALAMAATGPLLYIITVHAIMSCHIRTRNYPIVMLDKTGGSDLNCSTISARNQELIVAKSETVHIFQGEETRGEHAFPGDKKMVSTFHRYLIVVTAYLGVKRSHAHRVEVCIYDKQNKYVAFRRLFDNLVSIVSEWGAIYILTKQNLIKLRDKDLQEKLNEFFRINLYEKAIQLAKSEGAPHAKVIQYYCKYGDWLYEKDDFDQAMEQYLQTIDVHSTIEPSYVIRKFLDAQKIKNLTEYLARLHEIGAPTKDHTTLLLNCYTKLKDSSKLNEFIHIEDNNNNGNNKSIQPRHKKYNFDVSTAINVCREAGLLDHARSLAKQDAQHTIYLEILMEEGSLGNKNLGKFQEALKYISNLRFLEAEKSLKKFGKTLIEMEPQGTTEVIKLLCIGWPVPDEGPDDGPNGQGQGGSGGGRGGQRGSQLDSMGMVAELRAHVSYGQNQNVVGTADSTEVQSVFSSSAVNAGSAVNPKRSMHTHTLKLFSNPEEFIHLFVSQPGELKNFLEFLVESCEASRCSTVIYNTLLEIYMREAFELRLQILAIERQSTASNLSCKEFKSESARVEACIMRVLRTESKYDKTHALALGKMYGVEAAVIYLYETLHLYHEIISHFRDKHDGDGIVHACHNFSNQDPTLWISAFTYFIKLEGAGDGDGDDENSNEDGNGNRMHRINETEDDGYDDGDENGDGDGDERGAGGGGAWSANELKIQLCLKHISKLNLLPPLMIIELLSNTNVSLFVIRDYVIQDLQAQQTQIDEDEQCIQELQAHITTMKSEIRDLSTKPQTFQSTKCSVCKAPLTLPTIHFMCGHSVHEKCLYHKTNVRCPACQMTHDQIYNKHEMMQKSKGDHQNFFRQLSDHRQSGRGGGAGAADAFKTIAEYFGRGVID